MTEIKVLTIEENRLIQLIRDTIQSEFQSLTKTQPNPSTRLSREEAAKYLGYSLPTLDKLTKQGKLTAYRMGRNKFYLLGEIEENIIKSKIKYR